jgi:hypothetical protein
MASAGTARSCEVSNLAIAAAKAEGIVTMLRVPDYSSLLKITEEDDLRH